MLYTKFTPLFSWYQLAEQNVKICFIQHVLKPLPYRLLVTFYCMEWYFVYQPYCKDILFPVWLRLWFSKHGSYAGHVYTHLHQRYFYDTGDCLMALVQYISWFMIDMCSLTSPWGASFWKGKEKHSSHCGQILYKTLILSTISEGWGIVGCFYNSVQFDVRT